MPHASADLAALVERLRSAAKVSADGSLIAVLCDEAATALAALSSAEAEPSGAWAYDEAVRWLERTNHCACDQAEEEEDVASLAALLTRAERREREACAKVADDFASKVRRESIGADMTVEDIFGAHCAGDIAAGIRARGGEHDR